MIAKHSTSGLDRRNSLKSDQSQDEKRSLSSSEKSEAELLNIRNIELLTDANIQLKCMDHINLADARKFVHTPKSGDQPPEDSNFFIHHYKQNKFIRDYMQSIDHKMKEWCVD